MVEDAKPGIEKYKQIQLKSLVVGGEEPRRKQKPFLHKVN